MVLDSCRTKWVQITSLNSTVMLQNLTPKIIKKDRPPHKADHKHLQTPHPNIDKHTEALDYILCIIHTERDQGSFGPRSSAIQLYLIQHWGGPFFWLSGEG